MTTTDTKTLPSGSRIPLIFTYHDIVAGQGFLVRVQMRGRLLARVEDDGVWIDGVVPDCLSAGARTLAEALAEFRREFTAVLYDLANEHGRSLDSLRDAVHQMMGQTDDPSMQEWRAAVNEARERRLEEQLEMRRLDPETDTFIRVEVHHDQTAVPVRDNVLEPEPALAA